MRVGWACRIQEFKVVKEFKVVRVVKVVKVAAKMAAVYAFATSCDPPDAVTLDAGPFHSPEKLSQTAMSFVV